MRIIMWTNSNTRNVALIEKTPVRWVKSGMVLADGRKVRSVTPSPKRDSVALDFYNAAVEIFDFTAEVAVSE
jgi:hypothetical protein